MRPQMMSHLLTFQTVFFMPGFNGTGVSSNSAGASGPIFSTVVQIFGSGFIWLSILCSLWNSPGLPVSLPGSVVVRSPLSLIVRSCVVIPSRIANRCRREPMVGVGLNLEEWDLNWDELSLMVLCLRNKCHIIGKLVQSMPPRGSNAEYAPRGT